jgi:hypothetical protein
MPGFVSIGESRPLLTDDTPIPCFYLDFPTSSHSARRIFPFFPYQKGKLHWEKGRDQLRAFSDIRELMSSSLMQAAVVSDPSTGEKRKRGRPRKYPEGSGPKPTPGPKRGRGRPRKDPSAKGPYSTRLFLRRLPLLSQLDMVKSDIR